MNESILIQFRIAKKDKKLTYKEIASLSDGMMSERTVERVFTGESPLTPDRFDFLSNLFELNKYLAGLLKGPSDISYLVIHEIMKLTRKQQMLLLELCRQMNTYDRN